MRLEKRVTDCPIARRMKKQVIRLINVIEDAKKISDVPDEDDVEDWWKSNDFQPWI